MQSVHYKLVLPLLPPWEDSSHSFPDPVWGPFHERHVSTDCSNVSVSHRLNIFMNCSSMGPQRSHKSCQQTCFCVGSPLSRDPQVLPGVCSSMGFPQGHNFLWASTYSNVGSSVGYRWISVPPWTSMGCRGTNYLIMVFSTGCRGIPAPASGALPLPPSSLTLIFAELFLSHILTSFF